MDLGLDYLSGGTFMRFIFTFILSFSLCTPAFSEVWYTSNLATQDMLDMFTSPQNWSKARDHIDVMQFYSQQLAADNQSECSSCGHNIFPSFISRRAFDRLQEWGIQVAIETGAVKEWDCDGIKNQKITIDLFRKMKTHGGLHIVSMDEPFVAAMNLCGQNVVEAARYIGRYMRVIRSAHDQIYPGQSLRIGLIDAYPHFTAQEIVTQIHLLLQNGGELDFFHLDTDRIAMKNQKINDVKFRADLRRVTTVLESKNVPFGVVFWGQDGQNPANNTKTVYDFIRQIKRLHGRPHNLIFQNWEQTKMPNGDMVNIMPNNLPEHMAWTGTKILLFGMGEFGLSLTK